MSHIILTLLANLALKCMINNIIRNIKTYLFNDCDIILTIEIHIFSIPITFRIRL